MRHTHRVARPKGGCLTTITLAGVAGNRLAAHLAAVADLHNEDAQSAILDAADNSVITHAVFPKLTKARTLEGFTDAARVVQRGHSLMQK